MAVPGAQSLARIGRILSAPPDAWRGLLAAAGISAVRLFHTLERSRAGESITYSTEEERRRFERELPQAHWPPLLSLFDLPEQVAVAVEYLPARACFLASAPWPHVSAGCVCALLTNCGNDVDLLCRLAAYYAGALELHPLMLPRAFSALCARGHFAAARRLLRDHPQIAASRGLSRAGLLANACDRGDLACLRWLMGIDSFARKAEKDLRYCLLGRACRREQFRVAEWLAGRFAYRAAGFAKAGCSYCDASVLDWAAASFAGAVWLVERFELPAAALAQLRESALGCENAPLAAWIGERLGERLAPASA